VTLVIDASAALYLLASQEGIEPFATFDLGVARAALVRGDFGVERDEVARRVVA